ncbi:hypothetical protein AB1Y20_008479 [Prymnesium parvum]|uniref:Uncharacterized protein n=1 Tax=Prymnesium parvum TaxID=97485 RepID=A0AB34IUN3_PRYPA
MDSVRNPSDDESLADWFDGIGKATENEAPWKAFAKSISSHTAASTVGLLRQVRDADIDTALASANLSIGFKNALCQYLVPKGGKPYQFVKPEMHEARRKSANKQGVQGKYQKKFPSQQNRLTLGRELGDQLSTLQLPETLLASIKHSKEEQVAKPTSKKTTVQTKFKFKISGDRRERAPHLDWNSKVHANLQRSARRTAGGQKQAQHTRSEQACPPFRRDWRTRSPDHQRFAIGAKSPADNRRVAAAAPESDCAHRPSTVHPADEELRGVRGKPAFRPAWSKSCSQANSTAT